MRFAILTAHDQLLEDWSELATRHDAPDDVTAMVPIVSAAFVQAWNATSTSEQRRYQLSWENSQGYIALQCEKGGHAIEVRGNDVLIKPPE